MCVQHCVIKINHQIIRNKRSFGARVYVILWNIISSFYMQLCTYNIRVPEYEFYSIATVVCDYIVNDLIRNDKISIKIIIRRAVCGKRT